VAIESWRTFLKILISTSSFAEYDKSPLRLLESNRFEVVLNPYKRKLKPEEVVALAKDCVGIIAGTEPLTEEVLRQLPRLKAISRCGTGLDNVDVEAAKKRGIAVRTTPDAPTQAVAELAIALVLSMLRQINFMDKQVRSGAWSKEMGRLLSGKTVGIIGLGRIGRRVAELLRPFGVKILGSEPKSDRKWVKENKVRLTSLEELLRESDVVTLHIPYTKENRNLINAKRLKIMKRGAILINTSRGGLVDEGVLYQALKAGHLGGAALDAMVTEPYHGPLKGLDNVILTPHVGSYALEARVQMEIEATKNLINMLTEGIK
jgi:D-3-phosphoglycerate dehydrogenase